MATNSRIAIRNPDDSFKSISCHWDGDLEHNGRILLEHYSSTARVEALIRLGDLSALGPLIGPLPDTIHNFENSQPFVTIAYHRDNGEPLEISFDKTEYTLLKRVNNSMAAFIYVWQNNEWYYTEPSKRNGLRLLEDAFKPEPELTPDVLDMLNQLDNIS